MSDSGPTEAQYQSLFSAAWSDPDFMADLMSGDQDKIRARWKEVGIDLDPSVTMHMHNSETKSDRFQVIPPKNWNNATDGAAGKCYGPLCLIATGPF